jgi:hypothetical protein
MKAARYRFVNGRWPGAALLLTLLADGGCGDSHDVPPCPAGAERCACYGNDTCNDGLECLSELCVAPDSSASGAPAAIQGGPGGSGHGDAGELNDASIAGESPSGSLGGSSNLGGGGRASGGTSAGGKPSLGGTGGASSTSGNLITNGDFSQGDAGWTYEEHSGGGALVLSSEGEFCIQSNGNLSFTLGWPDNPANGVRLEPGVKYAFSYHAKVQHGQVITAKVGEVASPYASVISAQDVVDATELVFVHPFVAVAGVGAVGVAFNGTVPADNFVCFDDVNLERQ